MSAKLYQAPLEGITGYIYRRAVFKIFGGVDKYFAPFISPYEKRIITDKEKNQLCREHNEGIYLVPQILTVDPDGFYELSMWLKENYGYSEINLNLGCPSATVASKGRGAGALGDTDKLDRLLYGIFEKCSPVIQISVKTRVGLHNAEEFEDILNIYNKYEMEELIIHPRAKAQQYGGVPDMKAFELAKTVSRNRVIYNGDINSKEDYVNLNFEDVMIGRGMLKDPSIFRQIKGGSGLTQGEMSDFLNMILTDYERKLSGDAHVLQKVKEIWAFMGDDLAKRYEIPEKTIKKIRKSRSVSEFSMWQNEAVKCLPRRYAATQIGINK